MHADRPQLERVVVADDNRIIRAVLGELFTRLGIEVIEAADGREALERILSSSPQLAVLDVVMPHLDGFQVADQLNKLCGGARPVIFMTTAVYKTSMWESEAKRTYGAAEYLRKPIDPDDLRARVNRYFQRPGERPADVASEPPPGTIRSSVPPGEANVEIVTPESPRRKASSSRGITTMCRTFETSRTFPWPRASPPRRSRWIVRSSYSTRVRSKRTLHGSCPLRYARLRSRRRSFGSSWIETVAVTDASPSSIICMRSVS